MLGRGPIRTPLNGMDDIPGHALSSYISVQSPMERRERNLTEDSLWWSNGKQGEKTLRACAAPFSKRATPHTRCSSCLCRQGRGFLLRALVGVEGGRTRRPARPEHRRQQNWNRAEGEDLLEQVRATAQSLSAARKLLQFLLEVQLTRAVIFVYIDARGAFLASLLPVLVLTIEPIALALIFRRHASVRLGI